MTVIYEWTVETLYYYPGYEDDPDIIDTDAFELLSDAIQFRNKSPRNRISSYQEASRLVLIRQEGNDVEGLTDRSWAYIDAGQLPDYFDYGVGEQSNHIVPEKYKKSGVNI